MKRKDLIEPHKSIESSLEHHALEYLVELDCFFHSILYDSINLYYACKAYPDEGICIFSKDKRIRLVLDGLSRNANVRMIYEPKRDIILLPIYSMYCSNYFNSDLVLTDFKALCHQFLRSPIRNSNSEMHKELMNCLIHELTHKMQNNDGFTPEMVLSYQNEDKYDNLIERQAYYNQMLSHIRQKHPQTMEDVISIANRFKKGSTFEKIYQNNKQEFLEIANDWLDIYLQESVEFETMELDWENQSFIL